MVCGCHSKEEGEAEGLADTARAHTEGYFSSNGTMPSDRQVTDEAKSEAPTPCPPGWTIRCRRIGNEEPGRFVAEVLDGKGHVLYRMTGRVSRKN